MNARNSSHESAAGETGTDEGALAIVQQVVGLLETVPLLPGEPRFTVAAAVSEGRVIYPVGGLSDTHE